MNNAKFVNLEGKENLETIGERAKDTLVEEFNIKVPQSKAIATIAYVFIKELMKEVEEDTVLNALELFSAEKNDGEFILTPGQEMKLLIKEDK